MAKNINQIYIANPATTVASNDLFYIGQFPYGPTKDAAILYSNFLGGITASNSPRPSVLVATTAGLDATYSNGAGGVGATLTMNAVGNLIIDGDNLTTVGTGIQSRALVKNQGSTFGNARQNGIYYLSVAGNGSTAAVLTRASDYDNSTPGNVAQGSYINVVDGTVNKNTFWQENGIVNTIGTDSITFAKINDLPTYNLRYVSSNGRDDTTADGSFDAPYKTMAYAFSQQSGASATSIFVYSFLSRIVETSAPAIKPWCYILGNNFSWNTTGSTFGPVLSAADWGTAGQVFEVNNCYLGKASITLDWHGLSIADVAQTVRFNNCEGGNASLSEQGGMFWQANSLNQVLEYNNPVGLVSLLNAINTGTFTHNGGVCVGGTYQAAFGNFSPTFNNVNFSNGVFLQTTTNTLTVTLNRTTPTNISLNPTTTHTITVNGDATSIIPAQLTNTGAGTVTINTISKAQSISPIFTPVNFTSATPPTGYSRAVEQDLKGIDTALGAFTKTVTGNSGGAISPSSGNLNIVGGTGITAVGSGNTITLNASGVATNAPSNYLTGGQFSWATGSPTQVSMSAIVCMDSTNTYQITTVAPIVFTSANLDTGSWSLGARYYAFICDNPTTPSPIVVVSLSPTTPNLSGHSGYTKFRYVGYLQSDSRGTAIDGFIQQGNSTQRKVNYVSADSTKFPVIVSGSSLTPALVACAGCIGANASSGIIKFQLTGLNASLIVYASLDTSVALYSFGTPTAGGASAGVFEIPLDSSQQFYYAVTGTGVVNMQVGGFVENL